MNILVVPTTDWIGHPVPNRLNFIFDILAENHNVYVLHFRLKKFQGFKPRKTKCTLIKTGWKEIDDPSTYYILNFSSHLRSIRRIIKDKRINIILSANILPSFMANFAGVPIVFDYLDHFEESASIYYPDSIFRKLVKNGVSFITRYNLKHAQSVITVTMELANLLHDFGIENVAVIPNGVDTDLLKPIQKPNAKSDLGLKGQVIGYVGSLEHWVDLELVVQALPRLNVTLLVVGPGLFTDYGEKIKTLARELDVEDKVIFTGVVRYTDLSTYLSAMDIGLNPLKKMKKNEFSAGGKVFNYLSCGRPVLSSRIVSLEKLLGNEIYYYDDLESFVNQTRFILDSNQDEMKYRLIAEKFDWRKIAFNYEEVLIRST
ncbi:MAG: glycosyltransferase [Methanotrichaceae archaeon]|nr:glycosyltransferase [Methanotrichaceae archaeon]